MKKYLHLLAKKNLSVMRVTSFPLSPRHLTAFTTCDIWWASLRIYLWFQILCHSKIRVLIDKPLYSSNWDAVVRSIRIIYIQCTLNLWGNLISLKEMYLWYLFFFLYRLRPNNHYIIMKHLRAYWFIVLYSKNEIWDIVVVLSDMPTTCQCSIISWIDLQNESLKRYLGFSIAPPEPPEQDVVIIIIIIIMIIIIKKKLGKLTSKSLLTILALKPIFKDFLNLWNVHADWNMCFNLMCQDAGNV